MSLPLRLALAGLALLALAAAPPPARPEPATVRVRLVTSEGAIVIALDTRHAPKTSANFLAYVDDGRLDDTSFYRAARRKSDPRFGFVQGGIGTDARRTLTPVPLEPTNVTGLRHLDGTVSMAHGANPDSATGNFSIMVGDTPGLDAKPGARGFAAFGRVVSGMEVVRRILAKPSCCGSGPMLGQMIQQPVKLIRAERLDGTPRPSGRPRPWLLVPRR